MAMGCQPERYMFLLGLTCPHIVNFMMHAFIWSKQSKVTIQTGRMKDLFGQICPRQFYSKFCFGKIARFFREETATIFASNHILPSIIINPIFIDYNQ